MSQEVELKLELTLEAAAFLEASPLLEGHPSEAEHLSIYFDTPEQTLFRRGLSLRIRRSGRKRVQTIKADKAKAGGLFTRSEWERPVTNDTPVIDETAPVAALLNGGARTIAPQFEVKALRRTWIIIEGLSSIELALDRGAASVGERRAPICEVELELKSGEPAALFSLARKIDAIVPVRLGMLSKAERGYRLLGPPPHVYKAEAVQLDAAMSASQAFQHVAHSCLRHYRMNEALLLERREPEALHQARVAIRRLRSAFSIFGQTLADPKAAHFREELRWLARTLGEARDLDVLVQRARSGRLRDRLEAARGLAYANVEAAVASRRVRDLMLNLVEWLADGEWLATAENREMRDMPAEDFAADALNRFRRRFKKRGAKLDKLPDEARHDLRKDAKKLRYAADFFVGLFAHKRQQRRHGKFLAVMEELQDKLGSLNDIVTGPEVLNHLGLADDREAEALLASGKKPKLLAAASNAHADLVDARKFWT